jgi:hypothetical protein
MPVQATNPIHFRLHRAGGAIIVANASLWIGAGTPAARRVDAIAFNEVLQPSESQSAKDLGGGTFTCVMQFMLRKDLNGRYELNVDVDGTPVFNQTQVGDVSNEPLKAALLETQFDIIVT